MLALAALALGALAPAACSEEDRRAWVSILPISEDGEADERAPGPFAVAADSTALLHGGDTLWTVARVPAEADGNALRPARIAAAVVSPDSSQVAFRLAGPTPAIYVWTRTRQSGVVARAFPGGGVTTLAWSPGGRLLAFEGHDAEGIPRSGVFDVETGLTGRHAVHRWLERLGRSIRFQSWVAPGRGRFLVGAGAAPEGGLAYVWDVPSGTFVLESHLASLGANAPAGTPQRGGIFSVDLAGDPLPETVALFRTAEGSPGALVLLDAGPGGVRATTAEPLLPAIALGLEGWKEAAAGPELYRIAEVGGRTTVLLAMPSRSPVAAIAFFQLDADGRLEPVPMVLETGMAPAILPDGTVGDQTKQLGIADLDGDGASEVVAASGARDAAGPVRWSADVFRLEGGRLVPAPALVPAALERIERLVAGG
jgi:hypothetical protein